MAKVHSSVSLLAICLMLLLTANTEIQQVEGALCERYSRDFRGFCWSWRENECNTICKRREHKRKGECHWDSRGRACFCYANC